MNIRILICLTFFCSLLTGQDFDQARKKMVEHQLLRRDIHDSAVIRAMETVPRHSYVPFQQVRSAYDDRPLPIGYGQTISQPYIVAYMTQIVEPKPDHRVLEIGTGSGYQAAVLAEIVDSVFTMEIIYELAARAERDLKKTGYENTVVKHGDGFYGWEEKGPFDAIVVTAAAEFIPPPLIAQLKEGGKMVIPVGSPFMIQNLMLIEKKGENIRTKSLFPVRFVPFTRAE